MYNVKSLFMLFAVFCITVGLMFVTSPALADSNSPDLRQMYERMSLQPYVLEKTNSELFHIMSLDFDPNNHSFLIYDCGTGEIQLAMDKLGIPYAVRNKNNAVTAQDLIDYDILIVGWKVRFADDTIGLDPNVIEEGITGRVILTGHDTDWHVAFGTPHDTENFKPADIFLMNCIGYILDGGSTGLLAHGQHVSGFDWLPESWGVEVVDGLALETITGFTPEGIESGIFDGLTEETMSNWVNSFQPLQKNLWASTGSGNAPRL